MSRFPKTLLLSRSVPPAPTGSAVIVGNLARQFRPDEMVVLGAYYVGSPGIKWQSDWPVLKYATLHPPDGWRGARWIRWAQFPLLLLRVWWTLVAERCQVVLAVFPDEIFLLAGYLVCRITGTPLYAYFHNTYLENREKSRFAAWLQGRVFATARHLFVMSEGMQRLYQVNYPALRCSPLVHSFNEPLPKQCDITAPPLQRPLRLVLFGNISASNAEAAGRLAELVGDTPKVLLTVLSGTNRTYLERLGFAGDRVTIETVSRDVLLERLAESDVVLLPHGFSGPIAEEEIATIFPTRTIEALISRRPILAHTPKDCFLTEFLERNGCALIVSEPSVEALAAALERLRQESDLGARLARRALMAAEQFQAPNVAAHLRNVMKEGIVARAPQPAVSR